MGRVKLSKPNLKASLILNSGWVTFLISPDRPISPKKTRVSSIAIFFTEEIIAAATAKSAAGSKIFIPPTIFKKISMLDK